MKHARQTYAWALEQCLDTMQIEVNGSARSNSGRRKAPGRSGHLATQWWSGHPGGVPQFSASWLELSDDSRRLEAFWLIAVCCGRGF